MTKRIKEYRGSENDYLTQEERARSIYAYKKFKKERGMRDPFRMYKYKSEPIQNILGEKGDL